MLHVTVCYARRVGEEYRDGVWRGSVKEGLIIKGGVLQPVGSPAAIELYQYSILQC